METTTKDSEIGLLPPGSLSEQSSTNTSNSFEIKGICNESIEIYEGNESESHKSVYEHTNAQSSNNIEYTSFGKTEICEANVS